ncbi:MAG: SoxR reducing system RseC family protein [Gammaproteobacteria bacterium]|nr:SoxR reducing system RseC family protein [Gammaproteobacteria bacterium]
METASGQVIAIHGDVATVAITTPVACPRCAAGKGCGAGLFVGGEDRRIEVRVPPGLDLGEGADVSLAISPRRLLTAAAVAYGLPLTAFVLCTGLGWLATGDDLPAALSGLAGLAVALLAGRRWLSLRSVCDGFVPVVEPGRG